MTVNGDLSAMSIDRRNSKPFVKTKELWIRTISELFQLIGSLCRQDVSRGQTPRLTQLQKRLQSLGPIYSVAMDDGGFIYVADVGNRRIQKFAP